MKKITIMILVTILGSYGALASEITLDMGVLPSDQGWDYSALGLNTGAVEAEIFSVDGSALTMNSMGQPSSRFGGSIVYRHAGAIRTAVPAVLEWTSRTLDYERTVRDSNFGFIAGFRSGNSNYGVGITEDKVSLFDGEGYTNISVDGTQQHTYRIETIAGASAYDFYVDDVLRASASARPGAAANDVYFGDGTGGANAEVYMTALTFSQIPEPMTASLALLLFPLMILRRNFCVGQKQGAGRLYLHLTKLFSCLYLKPARCTAAGDKWS